MKDGVRSLQIEPLNSYLQFEGPAKSEWNPNASRLLKGIVRISLTRPLKVRHISVKFKAGSHVIHESSAGTTDIRSSLFPKLKTMVISKTTLLTAGQEILPWEIDVPNIFPASLLIKRATIHYKVEVSVSYGNLHPRHLTAEHPIILLRSLLPPDKMSVLSRTSIFRDSISSKFHYEVDVPRMICLEQGTLPFSVRYRHSGNHKSLLYIRTQIVQTELYNCNHISKAEADMGTWCSERQRKSSIFSKQSNFARYTKRSSPVMEHRVDDVIQPWKVPLVLYHTLDKQLSSFVESPLALIYHSLEIIFVFENYVTYPTKVPISVISLPATSETPSRSDAGMSTSSRSIQYAFENEAHYPALESVAFDNSEYPHRSERPSISLISARSSVAPINVNGSAAALDSIFERQMGKEMSIPDPRHSTSTSDSDHRPETAASNVASTVSPVDTSDEGERSPISESSMPDSPPAEPSRPQSTSDSITGSPEQSSSDSLNGPPEQIASDSINEPPEQTKVDINTQSASANTIQSHHLEPITVTAELSPTNTSYPQKLTPRSTSLLHTPYGENKGSIEALPRYITSDEEKRLLAALGELAFQSSLSTFPRDPACFSDGESSDIASGSVTQPTSADLSVPPPMLDLLQPSTSTDEEVNTTGMQIPVNSGTRTSITYTKRQTRVYYEDDSDFEDEVATLVDRSEEEELPDSPVDDSMVSVTNPMYDNSRLCPLSITPPQLPRLSLGTTLSALLDLPANSRDRL